MSSDSTIAPLAPQAGDAMPQTEHKVFISYATPDRVAADRVCAALEGAGVSCWIAARDIEPGTIFPATIVDALNSAQAMVLILTEHAVASPHVLSEVGYAFNAKKRILPFRLSRADLTDELEYYLSLTQWLDAPEGCTNRYDPEAPATGPEVTQPLASNASAIARGGSWAGDVASLRVSRRIGMEPDAADGRIGFRCARDGS